jgi:adenylate kinase family enzyme
MIIQYDKKTGQILGEVSWMKLGDPNVVQVDTTAYGSFSNPRVDIDTHTLVESAIVANQTELNKQALIIEVNNLCSKKITNGLQSDALDPGKEMYLYQSEQIDQFNTLANMMDAVTNNKSVMQRCIKISTSEDAFVPHTPEQIKQVVADGKQQILNYLQHCKALKDQINTANDLTTINSIDIGSGW